MGAPKSDDAAITLHGTFVDLRPLRGEDAELTFGWRHSQRARFLNRAPESVEQQSEWIASRPADERNFIIQLKDSTPIGMLSLIGIDLSNLHAEPARFLIGEEAAARGLPAAAEATMLLYELAFDRLGLHRVFGSVASQNTRMIKWQRFMGMAEEGRMRDHYCMNGRFHDAVIMGLLAADYRHVTLPRLRAFVDAGRPRPPTAQSED